MTHVPALHVPLHSRGTAPQHRVCVRRGSHALLIGGLLFLLLDRKCHRCQDNFSFVAAAEPHSGSYRAVLPAIHVATAIRVLRCGDLLSALCAIGLEGHWAGGVHSVACCVVLTGPSSVPAVGETCTRPGNIRCEVVQNSLQFHLASSYSFKHPGCSVCCNTCAAIHLSPHACTGTGWH
jgi:hypothetical protein